MIKAKKLVTLSNVIGTTSIILLIYWIFTFITIQVFGLKVFRENVTETFYMSIMGILALMFGALIINIMFNLTRIAEKHNNDTVETQAKKKYLLYVFIASFPLIVGYLFWGDASTSKQKERHLSSTAESLLANNEAIVTQLSSYSFDNSWINETNDGLTLLSKMDRNFPSILIIVPDTINDTEVYLSFSQSWYRSPRDTAAPQKIDFIHSTTEEERVYLDEVFNGASTEYRYSAHDGNYELFYPLSVEGHQKVVLYFSDRAMYGKRGSY